MRTVLTLIRRIVPRPVFSFYHLFLAKTAALYYGSPSKKLKVIGVTGTKGKSSVVYLISRILEECGEGVGANSSFESRLKGVTLPTGSSNSMPGRFQLQKFLYKVKHSGAKYAVIEVTSEGIAQYRHAGIVFDTAVFTNLEPEHIERHGSFEKYYKEKQKLFANTKKNHVVNADSHHAELFMKFPAAKKIVYGIEGGELRARNIDYGRDSTKFMVGNVPFETNLIGEINVYNALAAIGACIIYGVPLSHIADAFKKIQPPPGRLQEISEGQKFRIFVDYAHTPESLTSVYKTAQNTGSKKLVCVLGAAGGGRDKWKRPELGKVAAEYCNEIILTNEDPFDEDPQKIINDVAKGITGKKPFLKIIDRGDAIKKALSFAKNDTDAVIITGKGSEGSIRIKNGKSIPWNDAEFVKQTLAGR